MGFNSTVVVMNDALHDIRGEAAFGAMLHDAVLEHYSYGGPVDVRAGCHANAATVVDCHHADNTSLILVGGNCASVLGEWFGWRHHLREEQERLLKLAADALGYRLVRKSEKKS